MINYICLFTYLFQGGAGAEIIELAPVLCASSTTRYSVFYNPFLFILNTPYSMV